MPQMAPLSWLNLFIYFIFTFLVINSLTYYYFFTPATHKNMKKQMKMNKNWKW